MTRCFSLLEIYNNVDQKYTIMVGLNYLEVTHFQYFDVDIVTAKH